MSDNHSQVPNYYGTQEGAQQVYGSTNAEHGSGEQGAPQLYEVVRDNADFGSQGHGIDSATHSSQNAYNSRRPLNTQPVPEGGVAREGRQNLPEGQASYGDKLIGKVEKVTGKLTRNPELHEKGELRESGGRAAQRGEARAPHD